MRLAAGHQTKFSLTGPHTRSAAASAALAAAEVDVSTLGEPPLTRGEPPLTRRARPRPPGPAGGSSPSPHRGRSGEAPGARACADTSPCPCPSPPFPSAVPSRPHNATRRKRGWQPVAVAQPPGDEVKLSGCSETEPCAAELSAPRQRQVRDGSTPVLSSRSYRRGRPPSPTPGLSLTPPALRRAGTLGFPYCLRRLSVKAREAGAGQSEAGGAGRGSAAVGECVSGGAGEHVGGAARPGPARPAGRGEWGGPGRGGETRRAERPAGLCRAPGRTCSPPLPAGRGAWAPRRPRVSGGASGARPAAWGGRAPAAPRWFRRRSLCGRFSRVSVGRRCTLGRLRTALSYF